MIRLQICPPIDEDLHLTEDLRRAENLHLTEDLHHIRDLNLIEDLRHKLAPRGQLFRHPPDTTYSQVLSTLPQRP